MVLRGVACADDPILQPENCLTISRRKSGITSIDASKETYCIIRSPLPKAFNVLRAIERAEDDSPFSIGPGASQNDLEDQRFLPIACELKFDVCDFRTLALGNIWREVGSLEPGYIHAWTEPVFLTEHYQETSDVLRKMFCGLELEISPKGDKPWNDHIFDGFGIPRVSGLFRSVAK